MADSSGFGENYSEVGTMSKREYYTLRDKGMSMHSAPTAKQQLLEHQQQVAMQQEMANQPAGPGQRKYSVVMLDGSTVPFVISANASSDEMFATVCEYLGLHEKEYFGLCYRDAVQNFHWLHNEKKLDKQLKKSDNKMELMVKFYPPDPENLREHITRYFVTLQLRQNLMADLLPCSITSFVVLGSYVVQSEVGDFSEELMPDTKYLDETPFCPEDQRTPELMERVRELHRCHRGMLPEEADVHFLTNSKKLAMYGVDLHLAKDAKGEEVSVGVYHGGVVVYRNSLRINRFSWPKILKVSYKGHTLKLAIRTSAAEDSPKQREPTAVETVVEFKCSDRKLAKRLWRAVVEHHGFFRLKAPEKPKKPLIPGTVTRRWNYTGPTAQQMNDQDRAEYPETPVTQGMRKSFKKKNSPIKAATEDDGFNDDGFNRELEARQQEMQNRNLGRNSEFATSPMGQQRHLPNLQEQRPSRWAMCPADADPLLAAGLDADTSSGRCPPEAGGDWQGVRANHGVSGSGKWYYETTVGDELGADPVAARIGWSAAGANLKLGEDEEGFGFGQSPDGRQAQKLTANLPQQYGVELRSGDVVGAFVDLDSGSVEFSVNGNPLGAAFQLPAHMQQQPLFPASACVGGVSLDWNFGDDPSRPLAHRPPAPWRPIAHAEEICDNPRLWRLNSRDTTGPDLCISPDLCVAQAQDGWQGVRADRGLLAAKGGKFYYEVEPLEESGLGRVGWTTEAGSLDVGSDARGWGYGADYDGFGLAGSQGKRLHDNQIDTYGEPFAKGDVIGCSIDLDAGSLEFSRNGRQFGQAYQLSAADLANACLFPTVCMKDQTLDVNLGERPFKFQPSVNWQPVCAATDNQIQLSRTAAQNMKLPSVDQKYDMIRNNRPQIRPEAPAVNVDSPQVTVHESRTEHDEYGEPQEEIVTYKDEHGNTITTKKIKQTRKRQVVTSKVVESRGYGPYPGTEQLDRAMNGGNERPTARRNLIQSDTDEGDDMLSEIIFQQTGFNKQDAVVDEAVNDFSMSTMDAKKQQVHESEI